MRRRKKKTLKDDPRWPAFVERYAADLPRFSVEVCDTFFSWQQFGILLDVQMPDCRVSVPSGHGTGKSRMWGLAALWHLTCFLYSNTLITATNITQVSAAIWKEMADMKEAIGKNLPWLYDHIEIMSKKAFVIGHKDTWFILAKTASKAKPENIAGFHRKHYLILMDEASGVDDTVIGVVKGGLTESGNRFVMASQPTRNVGHFAESLTTLRDKIYKTHELNAEESPFVSLQKIREWLIEYGGHHSPQYHVKVLGRLPDNLSGFLISKRFLEDSAHFAVEHEEPWGWLMTVDVAEGVHRDSSCWAISKVSGYGMIRRAETVEYYETMDMDELAFARRVYAKAREYENITIAVDADGPGRTVFLTLEDLGLNVEKIRWGFPCHSEQDRKNYRNLRAYASFMVRQSLIEERLKLKRNQKLIDQGSKIPYKINDRGQYEIAPKEKMKADGIKSPDLFDVVCFIWIANYTPIDAVSGEESNKLVKWAQEIMEETG